MLSRAPALVIQPPRGGHRRRGWTCEADWTADAVTVNADDLEAHHAR